MELRGSIRGLLQNKLTVLSLIILGVVFLAGVLAPLLAPNDPTLVSLENKFLSPCTRFPLGTDHLGRCILSRLMYGAMVSLGSALLVMVITAMISVSVGTLSGYRGGWVDSLLMRLCDVFLAFPNLVLTLVIVGMLGPGLVNVIIAMVSVQWVWYARIIRGMVLSLKERGFILSARVAGTPPWLIIIRHIFPNIIPYIVVLATLDLGMVILHISGLSFLGLGVQPPTPEWGAMLNDAKQFLRSDPKLIMFPGAMILLVVISFNLLGDALRDVIEFYES
ncbi:nickel transport system permease protein [Desulfotomaculum arcticum]|uniref:Nickel transport system permease protein n=1 Tax=Desulfotruncus arcticus DSM 17038 TaxID=1121424 RepID=A0A1I2SYV2_9FIRM|nr:nickel ABC transporter permease subunit NikC [Desulfotruncus arcticus]SFG57803.1 nickel transport system permease protein [Desulfotomaculum arcticum] [Desulfotruncus arcticus DSM 17038]